MGIASGDSLGGRQVVAAGPSSLLFAFRVLMGRRALLLRSALRRALFLSLRSTWILGFGHTCLLTFGRRWLTGLLHLLLRCLWRALLLMLMGRHAPGEAESGGDP